MRRWLVAGAAVTVVAALVVLVAARRTMPPDALLGDFHTVERQCLRGFTDAIDRQGRNEIDEVALAGIVEHDVLPPWHAFKLRVEAAPDSPLVLAMRRYFEDRETAWQAFVTALRAPGEDPTAMAVYRQKNADADADAQALAKLLPR